MQENSILSFSNFFMKIKNQHLAYISFLNRIEVLTIKDRILSNRETTNQIIKIREIVLEIILNIKIQARVTRTIITTIELAEIIGCKVDGLSQVQQHFDKLKRRNKN